jgi:hypothetical protein
MAWQGTDANERMINRVHNGLVAIYLDGVKGVSPSRGHDSKMVSAAEADRMITRGREAYLQLVEQTAPRAVKGWLKNKISALGKLLDNAIAVRNGAPQKMTEADYAALRASLGYRTHLR